MRGTSARVHATKYHGKTWQIHTTYGFTTREKAKQFDVQNSSLFYSNEEVHSGSNKFSRACLMFNIPLQYSIDAKRLLKYF